MSFGKVDFNNGLGVVEAPKGATFRDKLGWNLGQRLSVSLGVSLNLRPVRSPSGQLHGLFGQGSPLLTMGAGYRITEFLKFNLGCALGTTQPDLPGAGSRLHPLPYAGMSLDFQVYKVVGRALDPVFGKEFTELEKRIPPPKSEGNAKAADGANR
jgi:hypothetical protein